MVPQVQDTVGDSVVWKIDKDTASTSEVLLSEGEVLKCKNWPLRTTSLCHHCCHSFKTVPVPLPQTFDREKRIYYCRGLFCSWNCAKSHNLANSSLIGKGDRNAYIALLAYGMWVKHRTSRPDMGPLSRSECSTLDRYSRYNISPSPPKECLKAFGGDVEIEQYRRGFFGIVPPEEAVVGRPFLNLREAIAKESTVLPFVNLSLFSRPAALSISKPSGRPTNTHRSPFMEPSGSPKGAALHKNANEFCSRLNKATDSQSAMLKRKRNTVTKNTLMSSMGIVVEKKNK